MNHSESIELLAKAVHKAQGEVGFAVKDAENPHFKSRYADLWRIWQAAKPVLVANSLSVLQTFEAGDGETVTIVTTLLHTSGQWINSKLTLKPTKPDPQGIGSAITYGKRYGLSSILGIVADEDDDGNGASTPKGKSPSTPLGTTVLALPAAWDDWSNDERGVYVASKGEKHLKDWWISLSDSERNRLFKQKEEWKLTAASVDSKKGSK